MQFPTYDYYIRWQEASSYEHTVERVVQICSNSCYPGARVDSALIQFHAATDCPVARQLYWLL